MDAGETEQHKWAGHLEATVKGSRARQWWGRVHGRGRDF